MAATAFTREAFVSATATVWVEALNPMDSTPPGAGVTQRSISLFLQEGCQAVVGGANLTLGNSSSTSLQETTTTPGSTSITPQASETPNPQYQQALSPGTIAAKNLQNKAYPDQPDLSAQPPPWVEPGWKNDTLTVSLRNWDLKVDSCGGPVSFRFQGEALMSTRRYNAAVDAFSDIVQV